MLRLMKVEAKKLLANRGAWGIVAGMLVTITLAALQTASPAEEAKPLFERQAYFLATLQIQLFLLILGAKVVTDEFRHGTIVPAFLVTPRRERFVVSKLAVVTGGGVFAAALGAVALLAASWNRMGDGLQAVEVRSLVGFVLAGAAWALIGAGLGFLVRHQVAAIVGVIVWSIVLDQMFAGELGRAAAYLPGGAGGSLAAAQTPGSMAAGAAILFGYAVIMGLAGSVMTKRRDVI